MTRAPPDVAEKYGVMLTDPAGRIFEFVEKPTHRRDPRALQGPRRSREFDRLPLLTNAGFYLIDAARLRTDRRGPPDGPPAPQRAWTSARTCCRGWSATAIPVHAFPVRRLGDLGNIEDYVQDHGRGAAGRVRLGGAADGGAVRPRAERLDRAGDPAPARRAHRQDPGREAGRGPGHHRPGRAHRPVLRDRPGRRDHASRTWTTTSRCGRARTSSRSQIRDGAIIGAGATIRESVIGSMSEVRSSRRNPTTIERFVALGDEVIVYEGASPGGSRQRVPAAEDPLGRPGPARTSRSPTPTTS